MKAQTQWNVSRVGSTMSTMDLARQAARNGAPHGWAVVADAMTGGRGTHGRAWHAPAGGLYMSFVLRDIPHPHLLTLGLGVAVAEVLEVAGADAGLKWVNDVWVDGRKIAGILVEAEATGDRMDHMVAGVGININGSARSFPADLRDIAVTLEDVLACDSCMPDLEAVLWERVGAVVDDLRQGRAREVLARWAQRDVLRGRDVVVDEPGGVVTGKAQGLDEAGRLIVQTRTSRVAVATGTVRFA